MTIPNHTRELLIRLASHMAYMQGQLEAHHQFDDPKDYYWYRESVALRQKVTDLLTDGPASVVSEPSDEEMEQRHPAPVPVSERLPGLRFGTATATKPLHPQTNDPIL